MSLTHVTLQEVQAGFDQHQSVSDQSGLSTVHVLGALVQVIDHTGDPSDVTLTVEPLSAAWKHRAVIRSGQEQTASPAWWAGL